MGRKLPWKTSSTPSGPERKTSVKSESPLPTPSRALHPGTPSAFHTTRSPSTSPPPEPPKERFMRPGLDHDDRYRIVEDEFVNMAHQFTLHIHASEYNRLKNLAKHQNADTIREIERPVVGAPTLLTRHRQEDVRRNAKQRKLLGNDANEKKDSPYVGSSLQGLMESPRKEHKWISTGLADTAATRASAGFNSQKISPLRLKQGSNSSSAKRRQISLGDDDETDDGDGLDPTTPSRTAATKAARTTHTSSPAMPRSTPLTAFTRKITKSRDAQEHIDDDDPFGINKRRIQRQKSREQFRKTEEKTPSKSSLDDIPSFI
ncbi:hypothetical protein FOC1_g10010111 [Fusarium oxysporum f. sp. cubense race 1]|uniref:Uncharacterized protein n=1 Tax=Fusarium oxysporum f. sp. cubense (strain race 1) TaxID=1229664 RepID=N4UC31_FUSC1|nr:hypothetical protein FOC1_g10010111 [Fusarium oxysporum f. sp. cubense race 1]